MNQYWYDDEVHVQQVLNRILKLESNLEHLTLNPESEVSTRTSYLGILNLESWILNAKPEVSTRAKYAWAKKTGLKGVGPYVFNYVPAIGGGAHAKAPKPKHGPQWPQYLIALVPYSDGPNPNVIPRLSVGCGKPLTVFFNIDMIALVNAWIVQMLPYAVSR